MPSILMAEGYGMTTFTQRRTRAEGGRDGSDGVAT